MNNGLNGSLPTEMGLLTSLSSLDVGKHVYEGILNVTNRSRFESNNLAVTFHNIPVELSALSNLSFLRLGKLNRDKMCIRAEAVCCLMLPTYACIIRLHFCFAQE